MASADRPTWNTQQAADMFTIYATPQHSLLTYDRIMQYHANDFDPYISLARGCTSPNLRILDMGCGTGFLSYAIAKVMHTSSSVIGLDCCQGLLNLANQKKFTEAPNASVEFKCADITDAQSLQAALGGSKFGLIVSSWTITNLPDKVATVKLWATTLLKDGGCLILDILHPSDAMNVFSIWKEEGDLANSQQVFVPYPPHQSTLPSCISLANSTTHAECKVEAASFARSAGLLLDCHPVKAYPDCANMQDWAQSNATHTTGNTREALLEANTTWAKEEESKLTAKFRFNSNLSNYKYGHKADAVIARFILGAHIGPNELCPCKKGKKFKQCHQNFARQ